MLMKARQSKHGSHPTILSKWYEQEGYRKSLAEHDIGEKEVMFFDHIALERHDCKAMNAKHWILRLNADGPQKASSTTTRICRCFNAMPSMQDAHFSETQQSLRPIRPEHQQRQR